MKDYGQQKVMIDYHDLIGCYMVEVVQMKPCVFIGHMMEVSREWLDDFIAWYVMIMDLDICSAVLEVKAGKLCAVKYDEDKVTGKPSRGCNFLNRRVKQVPEKRKKKRGMIIDSDDEV